MKRIQKQAAITTAPDRDHEPLTREATDKEALIGIRAIAASGCIVGAVAHRPRKNVVRGTQAT